MNSSDSEEDFESADEDVDSENKIYEEAVKKPEVSEKYDSESIVLGTADISQKVEHIQLKEESLKQPDSSESKPEIKAVTNERANSTKINLSIHEDSKIKHHVKKLGSKLTNDSVMGDKVGETQFSQGKEGVERTNENRRKPMKIGSKLTSNEIRVEANIEEKAHETIFREEDIKSKNHPGKDKSVNINEENIIQTGSSAKAAETTEKSEELNFEAGDGWELEEEDGFEIPVTLAKSGDGGIQCPQEQMCELDQVEFRTPKTEQEGGWGGWGGWGVSSLLSTASGTVTTFSSHVTAGLSTVLETTVGAPNPESLATEQASRSKEKEPDKCEDETGAGYGGLGSIVSGVSFLGTSVINRGLDTLETIGKKTMEVLQEGDPGLKKKRAMLFQNEDKPILSQILREAKERADNSVKEKEEKEAARKIHFESLFDDFQGMVHLEALEMLSTQCELKLQSLLQSQSGTQLLDLQETLSQVRELCEMPEEEEDAEVLTAEQFAEKITNCVEGLRIKLTPTKVIKVNGEVCERLEQQLSPTVVNETAISSLAELTAATMEFYHKSAELVMAKSSHNTADEAECYVQLTNHLCARISAVANEFTQLLTKNDPIANSSLITNIFLEASNSCSYVKNACQLLIPILQVGAVTT